MAEGLHNLNIWQKLTVVAENTKDILKIPLLYPRLAEKPGQQYFNGCEPEPTPHVPSIKNKDGSSKAV